ncbi:MAG TPA: ARMT1-like domain-containing protein, partial [Anaerolineales bacterium]|nr:ARMT1-like domain-containing protein [Anaerolineales bacterium]
MITKLDRPRLPLPEPLRGLETGSFAHTTIVDRLPSIGRAVLEENVFPAEATARLEFLVAELPSAGIRLLDDPGAPDEEAWNGYITPYLGMNWLEVPWFFAETYFYRRILEATGYFQPGGTFNVDPFNVQKRLVLEMAEPVLQSLADQLPGFLEMSAEEGQARQEALHRLILLNLWGNQADLSIWPVGDEGRPNH